VASAWFARRQWQPVDPSRDWTRQGAAWYHTTFRLAPDDNENGRRSRGMPPTVKPRIRRSCASTYR
jgi:hypothetical protein